MEKENKFLDEIKKCIGKEVTVKYCIGNKVIEKTGIARAFNFIHLNVWLMTDTEKILIKNYIELSRKRSNPNK